VTAAWGQIVGIITLVLMLLFVGIWIWAWRPRHRRQFDAMARMPMDDEPPAASDDGDDSR
jgi:cytochrome c oxidase cbb3-type subunit 4